MEDYLDVVQMQVQLNLQRNLKVDMQRRADWGRLGTCLFEVVYGAAGPEVRRDVNSQRVRYIDGWKAVRCTDAPAMVLWIEVPLRVKGLVGLPLWVDILQVSPPLFGGRNGCPL